jgi:hypothetical protein
MDQEQELAGLYQRRKIAQVCIRIADQSAGDPRRLDAMEHYKAQLAEIDAKIAAITGKPPPVVVRVKTAVLFPKSEQVKGK